MLMDKKTQTVKMSILPNLIYIFNTVTSKIPVSYFVDINKIYSKVYIDIHKTQNSQNNIKEEQSQRTDTNQIQDLQ